MEHISGLLEDGLCKEVYELWEVSKYSLKKFMLSFRKNKLDFRFHCFILTGV